VEVLRDVGRYPAENLFLVLRPDRRRLLAAVASLRERLRQHERRGEQTRLFFYYSGHARAHALNVGAEEIALPDLRQEILSLPSTLTVVVIDACQSGAFSRIKGAEPTADFSFNSVARLNTAGVAVMASSSAAELSQESDDLAASFFTHHLLVALRGAGDANRDGKVSLDEAYRYTYNRTLTGTAATAVGAQHATLETELRGKGDVILTHPAASSSRLLIPAPVAGRLFLQHRPSETVVAEVDKARGESVLLAAPPGGYTALLRQGDEVRECDVTLAAGSVVTFDVGSCRPSSLKLTGVKTPGWDAPRWGLELSLGALSYRRDGYTDQIRQFDFSQQGGTLMVLGLSRQISLTASRALGRHLALTLGVMELGRQEYHRGKSPNDSGVEARFGWSSYGLGVGLRAFYPLARDRFIPFVQVSAGPALAVTSWEDEAGSTTDAFVGYQLGSVAGFLVMPRRWFGFLLQGGYFFAPIIENRFGQSHDSGGVAVQIGGRFAR
jgi:hypothetical protein